MPPSAFVYVDRVCMVRRFSYVGDKVDKEFPGFVEVICFDSQTLSRSCAAFLPVFSITGQNSRGAPSSIAFLITSDYPQRASVGGCVFEDVDGKVFVMSRPPIASSSWPQWPCSTPFSLRRHPRVGNSRYMRRCAGCLQTLKVTSLPYSILL